MYSELRLRDLLQEMRKRAGSNKRLANRLKVTQRTLPGWFAKSEDELHRLRPDNIEQIIKAARDLGIEPELFSPPPRLWDFGASFEANLSLDPGMPPRLGRPFRKHTIAFLGQVLNSRFGASASVLTSSSSRVRFLAHSGVDVITYKTVRSRSHSSHPSPNILCCSAEMCTLDPTQRTLPPVKVENPVDACASHKPIFGMMNHFGMPSLPPQVWMPDFRAAKESLAPGQLLILSIVGTAEHDAPPSTLIEDFAQVAGLAVEAGAEVIEIDCSCPNCSGMEGQLYRNLDLLLCVLKAVSSVATRAHILLKIGFMRGRKLREFVINTAPYVRGYSAINSLAADGIRKGVDGDVPAFGGAKAGLSGRPILNHALTCVQELASIRESEQLKGIVILGMGGISSPQDVKTFLNSGADVVQATTAFFTDSYFGFRVRRLLDAELSSQQLTAEEEKDLARYNWIRGVSSLEAELGSKEAVVRAVRDAALADFLEWERRHEEAVNLGARRREPIPTPEDFVARIRKSLGKS